MQEPSQQSGTLEGTPRWRASRLTLVSLVACAAMVVLGTFAYMSNAALERELDYDLKRALNLVEGLLYERIDTDKLLMRAHVINISNDPVAVRGIEERDMVVLQSRARLYYKRFKVVSGISQVNFISPENVLLANVGGLYRQGESASNVLLNEARQRGFIISRILIEPNGTLNLWSVAPIFSKGKLIGFVEVAKDIGAIIRDTMVGLDLDLALFLRKSLIGVDDWETIYGNVARSLPWGTYNSYVIGGSEAVLRLPLLQSDPMHDAMNGVLSPISDNGMHKTFSMEVDDQHIHVAFLPFVNESGQNFGKIAVIRDYSFEAGQQYTLFKTVLLMVLLCTALVAIVYWLYLGWLQRRMVREHDRLSKRSQHSDMALKAAEDRVTHIFDSISDICFSVDGQWRVTFLNAQAEDLFELSREDLIGDNIWDALPDFSGAFFTPLRRAMSERSEVNETVHVVALNRWFDLRAYLSDDGLVVYLNDVTDQHEAADTLRRLNDELERKVAEQTQDLAAREEKLRMILDTAVDGIITIDAHGHVRTMNQSAERIFGYSANEVVGHNIKMLMPKPYRDMHDMYLANYIRSGEAHIIGIGREVVGLRKDGTEFPMDLAVSEGSAGGQRLFTGFVRDITERRTVEDDLRNARDEAELASKAKSKFLSAMSHDLRTPMNAILGFSQIMMNDQQDKLSRAHRAHVEQILSAGQHLLELINEVLDLSRIETGRLTLHLEPLNVIDMIDECLELTDPLAEEHDIAFEIRDEHGVTWDTLELDPTRFKQVLLNLLSNAVKYNKKGGQVSVIRAEEHGRAKIMVSDSGHGIAPDKIESLFEPFNRLDQDDSLVEGSGIGLTITKRLVELMGGEIGVESVLDKGTTFWLSFPIGHTTPLFDRETLEALESLPVATDSKSSDAAVQILFVSQSQRVMQNMQVFSDHFSEFNVRFAELQDVRKLLIDHSFDALLLDTTQQGIEKDDLLSHIRETSDASVFVLADDEPKDDASTAVDDSIVYLRKPVDLSVLLNTLKAAVEGP